MSLWKTLQECTSDAEVKDMLSSSARGMVSDC